MRKILGVFMVLCILLTMVPIYADDTSEEVVIEDTKTDGSISSEKWFRKMEPLFTNKKQNGDDFFEVLKSLRNGNLQSQVTAVYNDTDFVSAADKVYLDEFGFTDITIHNIMEDYIDSYPANMAQVLTDQLSSDPNIYSEIYHDHDLTYSSYMLKFNRYLFERFAALPTEVQVCFTKWDSNSVGQIHLNQNILNRFIEDKLFFEVYNPNNGVRTKDIKARDILEDIVRAEVESFATVNPTAPAPDLDEIERFARAYFVSANIILESAERNLKETSDARFDLAMELSKIIDLYDYYEYPEKDDPIRRSDPSITVVPDLGSIYYNPDTEEGETSDLQYEAVVGDSNSDVVWSIDDDGDIVTIDSTGTVRLNPDYVPNVEDSQLNFTVTAELEDDSTVSDTARLELVINPLGAPDFLGAYITGYEDQTFRGTNAVTREEMVTMFVRVMKFDIKGYEKNADGTQKLNANNLPIPIYYDKTDFMVPSYNDVGGNDWSYLYVEIANEKGWFPADDKGNFNPKTPIKRGEIPMVMVKVWEELEVPVDQIANHFIKDVSTDYKYFDQIQAFYNAKIVTGFEDRTYRPEDVTTRNEIVSMINKIINRPKSLLGISRFSDVAAGHWALGDIEAATQIQLLTQTITEQ